MTDQQLLRTAASLQQQAQAAYDDADAAVDGRQPRRAQALYERGEYLESEARAVLDGQP